MTRSYVPRPYEPLPINGEKGLQAVASAVQFSDMRSHERHEETLRGQWEIAVEVACQGEQLGVLETRLASVERTCKERPVECAAAHSVQRDIDIEAGWKQGATNFLGGLVGKLLLVAAGGGVAILVNYIFINHP